MVFWAWEKLLKIVTFNWTWQGIYSFLIDVEGEFFRFLVSPVRTTIHYSLWSYIQRKILSLLVRSIVSVMNVYNWSRRCRPPYDAWVIKRGIRRYDLIQESLRFARVLCKPWPACVKPVLVDGIFVSQIRASINLCVDVTKFQNLLLRKSITSYNKYASVNCYIW